MTTVRNSHSTRIMELLATAHDRDAALAAWASGWPGSSAPDTLRPFDELRLRAQRSVVSVFPVDSRLLETSGRAGVWPDSVQVFGWRLSLRLPTSVMGVAL